MNDDEMEQSKAFLRAYARLIEATGLRGLVTYGDIAAIMGLPPKGSHMGVMVGRMAGLIAGRERTCGRPMLSSVLVSSTNYEPGPGYYLLASEYGLLAPDASKADQRAFWEAERNRVYREWQS